jgi:hypothetical protein
MTSLPTPAAHHLNPYSAPAAGKTPPK